MAHISETFESNEKDHPVSTPRSISTTELVHRCRRGDASAWNALVERYAGLVHSIPVRHHLAPMDVDDVGQETFLALARAVDSIENPEALASWLVITARRLSWRAVQKCRREENLTTTELDNRDPDLQPGALQIPGVETLLGGWQQQEMLQAGLDRLGSKCRSLIYLLFLDVNEPSYEQIGERLEVSVGSIGPTRSRCLQQLRSILEGLGFTN